MNFVNQILRLRSTGSSQSSTPIPESLPVAQSSSQLLNHLTAPQGTTMTQTPPIVVEEEDVQIVSDQNEDDSDADNLCTICYEPWLASTILRFDV